MRDNKTFYLVCNAHLDLVWQWEWHESLAEALSTFRIAAAFCETYDGFIFNHNEAKLYQWIEEYDPPLFQKIQDLVQKGKWHIMGGWYLQPDCVMSSGESIFRQMEKGLNYFREKFGCRPRTAINVDSFGHDRGLVQLLLKSGYTSYLVGRPSLEVCKAPGPDFLWEGYDGTCIPVHLAAEGYNSGLGKVRRKLEYYRRQEGTDNSVLALWGIGNHGGGPSKEDLDEISLLQKEWEKEGVQLIHSTPEMYFDSISGSELPLFDREIGPSMPGCYTSQVRIKQTHCLLENMLYQTEKLLAAAEIFTGMEGDWESLKQAEEILLFNEFHDILPGTSVQRAEDAALREMGGAISLLEKEKTRAFMHLCRQTEKLEPGVIPIFACNPHPWPVKAVLECEFQLQDQGWDYTYTDFEVRYQGEVIPSQLEKEGSSIPLDWRKRLVFMADIPPFATAALYAYPKVLTGKPELPQTIESEIRLEGSGGELIIDKKSGLISSYRIDGISLFCPGAARLVVIADNEDPWGMTVNSFPEIIGEFTPASPEQAGKICGLDKAIDPVHIIEHGPVRTVVEAIFLYKRSAAIVHYKFQPITNKLDLEIHLQWNEPNHMVKLSLPTPWKNAECWGQKMLGRARLYENGTENVSQKWISVCNDKLGLTILNRGSYGSSFENGELRLTLLRSPAYTAHPIDDRIILPQDRFLSRIDIGERSFLFSIHGGERECQLNTADKEAAVYNEAPFARSYFTNAGKPTAGGNIKIDEEQIQLLCLKRTDAGYLIHLYNSSSQPRKTRFTFIEREIMVELDPFELKAFHYSQGILEPCGLITLQDTL